MCLQSRQGFLTSLQHNLQRKLSRLLGVRDPSAHIMCKRLISRISTGWGSCGVGLPERKDLPARIPPKERQDAKGCRDGLCTFPGTTGTKQRPARVCTQRRPGFQGYLRSVISGNSAKLSMMHKAGEREMGSLGCVGAGGGAAITPQMELNTEHWLKRSGAPGRGRSPAQRALQTPHHHENGAQRPLRLQRDG